jgi:hypothetical protein
VDKEYIAKIVGELYLNNCVLMQQLRDSQDEVAKLKKLLDELGNGTA